MPSFSDRKPIAIVAAGGTITLPPESRFETYVITGSGTLLASVAIAADMSNAQVVGKPGKAVFYYQGNWQLDGNSFDIVGYNLTQEQAAGGNLCVIAIYDGAGNWTYQAINLPKARTYAATRSVDVSGGATINVNPAVNGKYLELTGTGPLAGAVAITGNPIAPQTVKDGEQFEVKYNAQLDASGFTVTLFGISLTPSEIKSGNITVKAFYKIATSSYVTQKIVGSNLGNGLTEMLPINGSFETDEVGAVTFKPKYQLEIAGIRTVVTKTVAATDIGTFTFDVDGTPLATVSVPADSTVGTEIVTTISPAVKMGTSSTLNMAMAKTTAGGRAVNWFEVRRITY